jgi:hypothetical protein
MTGPSHRQAKIQLKFLSNCTKQNVSYCENTDLLRITDTREILTQTDSSSPTSPDAHEKEQG